VRLKRFAPASAEEIALLKTQQMKTQQAD